MDNYTVYYTYRLFVTGNTFSYNNNGVHCGYINSKGFENISNKIINLKFSNVDDFKFMDNTGNIGFLADTMHVLVQIVTSGGQIRGDKWKVYDVTNQISGHTVGNVIIKENLVSTIFEIKLNDYTSKSYYDISYLNYPLSGDTETLCFGDEEYMIGNVDTLIGATAHTMDIQLTLPTNRFNYSTNKTWTQGSSVFVTEIGIYDSNYNLVGIGVFNKPVKKNSKTSRTFVFEIDF